MCAKQTQNNRDKKNSKSVLLSDFYLMSHKELWVTLVHYIRKYSETWIYKHESLNFIIFCFRQGGKQK